MRQIELKRDQRLAKGERTRRQILAVAVDLASAQGLEGLTIGRLARRLKMSKSGLFIHFGSKEGLQLATVAAARDIFVREVMAPAEISDRGMPRLKAYLESWVSYVERNVFCGGCFFAAVSAEFDGRPGAVRDLIVELTRAWVVVLEEEADRAMGRGEIAEGADLKQLVFEVHALVQEANWAYQLHGDGQAFARARQGILRRLEAVATTRDRDRLSLGGGGDHWTLAKEDSK